MRESFFRGETSWIPAAFARRSIVLERRLGAQVAIASARE
jgi:hypothetical protein